MPQYKFSLTRIFQHKGNIKGSVLINEKLGKTPEEILKLPYVDRATTMSLRCTSANLTTRSKRQLEIEVTNS